MGVVGLEAGKVGIITDLHANPLALKAVLDDGTLAGVDRWLCLGDVVAMGYDPVGVLELLSELHLVGMVSGNTERYVLTGDRPDPTTEEVIADPARIPHLIEVVSSFAWTRGFVEGHRLLGRLGEWEPHMRFVLPDATRLLAVHASLAADDGTGIRPDAPEAELVELFEGHRADLIVGGHTHEPTDRTIGGVRFVNPGSVSNPNGADKRARYTVLDCREDSHELDHRAVDYDVGSATEQVRASSNPCRDYLLRRHFT
jgi:predicted phosphodiesterase